MSHIEVTLSPFGTLPCVTFTNAHGDEPQHHVWIFQTVAEADAAADKLRSDSARYRLENIRVMDGTFKGATS